MAEVIRIKDDTYRVEDGGVRFYVFCGVEKAAVIDTGMNVPDARQIAETITDLPLILVNTHADPDHISGNNAFDSFYMSPAEDGNYRDHGGQKEYLPVKEGDVIELGERSLLVIDIPGHTPGSIALLDEKNRILVSGDSVQNGNIFMFGKRRDLAKYVESMKHLLDFEDRYDEIYPMHGGFPQKPSLVRELLEGAREILDEKAQGTQVDVFGNQATLYKFPYAGFLCDRK